VIANTSAISHTSWWQSSGRRAANVPVNQHLCSLQPLFPSRWPFPSSSSACLQIKAPAVPVNLRHRHLESVNHSTLRKNPSYQSPSMSDTSSHVYLLLHKQLKGVDPSIPPHKLYRGRGACVPLTTYPNNPK
jgi:hypothetical protein